MSSQARGTYRIPHLRQAILPPAVASVDGPRERGKMRTRGKFGYTALMAVGLVMALAATALAADINTDASLSSNSALPTSVSIGSNSFTIDVWATGNLAADKTGVAQVVNKYDMATNGTITPDSTSKTTLNFTVGYNYSQCSTETPANAQGCASNHFVVNATLVVAAGTPGGTTGTLTVSTIGSTGLSADGSPDTGYVQVSATNHAPAVAAGDASVTVNEGGTATNTGTWSDADAGDTVTLSASVGSVVQSGTNASGTWSWAFGTTDGPDDSQTVTITANDGHTTTSTTFSLVVNNVAPTTTLTTPPSAASEGDTNTYNFSVSDPGADTYSGTASCGTGGSLVASSLTTTGNSGSQTGSFQCLFPDGPANPTVSIHFTDSDSLAGTAATQPVTVANVKPSPSIDSVDGTGVVACIGGNTLTLGFSWTDPAGTNDNYNYDVAWGDGNHTTHAAFDATSPISGLSHNYAAGGPYTIIVTVNDDDPDAGNTASSSEFSFLYNVTGVLQPVNDTQAHQVPSVFKYGSTLPVKIQVTDCHSTPVSGLSPKVVINKKTSDTPTFGVDESIANTNTPDSGGYMRWSDPIYIYNLSTGSLSDKTATYQITITGPFQTVMTLFGTKAK